VILPHQKFTLVVLSSALGQNKQAIMNAFMIVTM